VNYRSVHFFIGVILLLDVLGIINILSTTLQSKTRTLGKAKHIINGVILSFEKLRRDEEFFIFWQKLELLAEQNNITLDIPDISMIQLSIQIYFV